MIEFWKNDRLFFILEEAERKSEKMNGGKDYKYSR